MLSAERRPSAASAATLSDTTLAARQRSALVRRFLIGPGSASLRNCPRSRSMRRDAVKHAFDTGASAPFVCQAELRPDRA
jgi:hypothetical protein